MFTMSQWKDPLATPSSSDEFLRLQNEIAHLQQENKVLHIRAQGVQVLGKVLQDSQENNAKLKKEVEQLKSHLVQKGIDAAQADLSVCTVDDDVLQSAVVEQGGSHHSSLAKSSTGIHDYVNVTTVSGPHSFSAGFPSLLLGEFHIKASRENAVQEVKKKLDRSKEKNAQIQSEIKFFQEAVLVKREHESALPNRQPSSLSSEQSAVTSRSDETGPETCEGCIQLQRQTTELQRQLLATKAEKDEALKLKEEILDVNHKWDAQYKMLVAATNKEISNLKHQVHVLGSPDRRTDQFPEPTMMERRVLDQRCKQLENKLQQKQLEVNHLQLFMRNRSGHILQYQQPWTPQSPSMEQQPSHSSILDAAALPTGAPAAAPAQGPTSWPGTTLYSQQISPEVQIYEEDFKREKRENASLQQQLKANYTSSGGGYQYQDPLTQRAKAVAEQQARVQAIKEVHDREMDRLLRGQQELQLQHVYGQPQGSYSRAQSQYNPYGRGLDYTNQEWQRQNYPLVPRGSFPPRGPIAHPASQRSNANSMYHGGEVLHDRVENVVDSPADGNDTGEAGVSDKEVILLEACLHCLIKSFETPAL